MLESKEFLNKLDKDRKVVLACSGGPDSMFLLELLIECGFSVVVAHVNHKMRLASDQEYVFMEEYCKEKGVIFEGTVYESGNLANFHNDSRIYRYKFFYSLVKKYNAKYLFTAHHGDDLMETILMRLNRGSSIRGYSGFKLITQKKDFFIVRPLLYMTKKEIQKYDEEHEIPYVIDESNLEDHYTRNRYRHNVLPFFKQENEKSHLKFLEFSTKLSNCESFISKYAKKIIDNAYKDGVLDLTLIVSEDKFIIEYILEELVNLLYPDDLYEVDSNNISEIMKSLVSNKPNIVIKLPNHRKVIKEYDRLLFIKDDIEVSDFDVIFKEKYETDSYTLYTTEMSDDSSNYTIRLNSKEVKLPLHIRNRKDGDKIEIKNMNGSKKVSDVFIDEKISSRLRNSYPILTDDNGYILWLPGLKKSKKDVPLNECYDIIVKYEKKEK